MIDAADEERARSSTWDRREDEAIERREWKRWQIKADMLSAWVSSNYSAPVDTVLHHDSLTTIVSEDLCDVPGNPLHDIMDLLRDLYWDNHRGAVRIITRICRDHADRTVELMEADGRFD